MPKAVRIPISLFVLAALTTFTLAWPGYAFHEGGVDNCQGCHVIHQSQGDQNQDRYNNTSSGELKGLDSNSTCLRCHAEKGKFYNVLSNDGSTYSAGGDFYWLKKTFTWTENGKECRSSGDSHGHNVVAVEYGLNQENTLNSAPGGMYSSPFRPSKMILIFSSGLNLRRVLRIISLTTDSGRLLVLGAIRASFHNFDYNLKPSLFNILNLSTFL